MANSSTLDARLDEIVTKLNRIENITKKLDTQSNLNKPYLTEREACAFLGITRSTLRRHAANGKLTKMQLGGRVAYVREELQNLYENPALDSSAA